MPNSQNRRRAAAKHAAKHAARHAASPHVLMCGLVGAGVVGIGLTTAPPASAQGASGSVAAQAPEGASPTASLTASPLADQDLGKRFLVTADDVPAPDPSTAVRNPALTVPHADNRPTAPEGFTVTLFAELDGPRQMLALDNGGVLVAQQKAGQITYLEDTDDDGEADIVSHFAQNFDQPYGLARLGKDAEHAGDILVADVRGVWRVPYEGGIRAGGAAIHGTQPKSDVPPEKREPQQPMDHLAVTEQGVFGSSEGHSTRSLALHPETGEMYAGVGSAGNVSIEEEPRATVQVFGAGGGDQRTFATGTRNPIGIGFHPSTGDFWAIVQERDGLGDELVSDFFTRIAEGDFYGWPYSYTGSHPQPGFAERAPEGLIETAKVGEVLFEAHSAAMDFVFYTGTDFPEEYHGDAFVALKGSWNRSDPTGYKVVRVPFENGEPTDGSYENFLTGFWVSGDDRAEVWGRPADVTMSADGSLLVADDTGGTIWKVRYDGGEEPEVPTPVSDEAQTEGSDAAEGEAPAAPAAN